MTRPLLYTYRGPAGAASPKGTVLEESLHIMRWAFEGRDAHRDQAATGLLQALEQRLSAQPYLGGAPPCATDLAIFPFVRQFRAVDTDWFDAQTLPATQQWLQGWLKSELFAACMKKLP